MYHKMIPLGENASQMRACLIEAKLRRINGVVSALFTAGCEYISVYARNYFAAQMAEYQCSRWGILKNASRSGSDTCVRMKELTTAKVNAAVSLVGFGALILAKRFVPGIFSKLNWFKNAFVLIIAKNILINGMKGVLSERRPNADTLTSTAVIASLASGKPESSLSLLVLSNFAEMLTQSAAEKARRHISKLMDMEEKYVWKEENGVISKVSIESVRAGDRIVAYLGEKISVDGTVISGEASIDQSSLTGEFLPALKQQGDAVYAGTVMKSGRIVIDVKKVGDDTNIARVINMVENAQNRRAPIQNFADRMANMLVPISFISAALVYAATRDIQRVLNMFFIDFSCGLKLSTSTAISAALSKSAQLGVLIKGGNFVENLADIDTVIFDKTGTITDGHPKVVELLPEPMSSDKELVMVAAAAEYASAHPMAESINAYAAEMGWVVPTEACVDTVIGKGVAASLEECGEYSGGKVLVGSLAFMEENGISAGRADDAIFERTDATNAVYVARDGVLLGTILVSDPIRKDFKKTINRLRRLGVDEVLMLTGDTKRTAEIVANQLDLDGYRCDAMPKDKADFIVAKQGASKVLMVGDGINDAPALAYADIGVAMGGKSTDIAVESADLTITSDDPLKLPTVIELSKKTMTMVRQNFAATIAINATAMLLGALGKINPLLAATIHNASTIGVVLNSSRILFEESSWVKGARRN